MNPTNKPLTVYLDGKRQRLYFDLNTFSAFEEVTGKYFLDYLADLQAASESADPKEPLSVIRKISLKHFRAFLWAALHTYDGDDEPQWPYTISALGKVVDVDAMARLLPEILRGSAENLPGASDAERPTEPKVQTEENSPPPAGGPTSGPSDEEILSSMTEQSDD